MGLCAAHPCCSKSSSSDGRVVDYYKITQQVHVLDHGSCCLEEVTDKPNPEHVTRWPPDHSEKPLEWDDQFITDTPAHVRSTFVKKVYSILAVQTGISALIAFPIVRFVDEVWLHNHVILYYVVSCMSLVLFIGSACCCQGTLRRYPATCCALIALTVLSGICIGFVCVMHSLPGVAISAATTAAIFLGLTVYACITGTDFAGLEPYMFAACFGVMVLGLLLLYVDWGWGQRVYGGVGAVLFSFYAIYATQRVLGGTHRSQFCADEYAFAALSLYLDVISLSAFRKA
mmetsp:Transcript_18192/g.50238  ORF Transcript_18192/g.50238 Transcript_18192/m.50238 type:complete len:287 (-) Transcript_18192:94-954(-)